MIILFKNIYTGMMLDLETNQEYIIFDESIPGYVKGLIPMDFPPLPSFWRPRITNRNADKILIIGPPVERESPDLYMVSREEK